MSRWLTISSFSLAGWALAGVIRAILVADRLAAGSGAAGTSAVASTWAEAMIWLAPAAVLGVVMVLAISRPGSGADPYLARNVRLGVLVALFALLLAWSLVLFAAYVGSLAPRSAPQSAAAALDTMSR